MENNALATRAPAWEPMNADSLLTKEDYALVKNQIAPKLTDGEFKLFLYECKRKGVHPSDRLIIPTKFGDRVTYISTVNYLRMCADQSGTYAGNDEPEFFTEPANDPSGERCAKVTVWKLVNGVRCPFSATARFSEYRPEYDGGRWDAMPKAMLAKCAEALALRKAFPAALHGLYVREEMEQAQPEYRPAPSITNQPPNQPSWRTMKPAPASTHTPASAPVGGGGSSSAAAVPSEPDGAPDHLPYDSPSARHIIDIPQKEWDAIIDLWREDPIFAGYLKTVCQEEGITNAKKVVEPDIKHRIREKMARLISHGT